MFKNNNKTQAGFSFVELLVSIGIASLVMGMVITKHTKSNSAVLLRSQAYEIALDIRETQLKTVSATGLSGVYRNVLGLHFSTSVPKKYNLFKDVDLDNYYDNTEKIGLQGILDSRFKIDSILLDSVVVSDLSIVFERPNFDAKFFTGSGSENKTATTAKINIRLEGSTGTGRESIRTIEITRTGQIIVQ